ncbi:MAG: ATP-binding cassette domain-containing protein [Planctomycetes bacterium]|nr:ATP-binding cassette domain-containing protein [Planctomycetota bacterium]
MIEVKNLTKYYGNRCAVDHVSFKVNEGEIVGFLGPNGAGKSTTIRVIACFLPATSGSVSVSGHDVFKESMAVRRLIGYLPENVPLYPEMRTREYLNFRGKLHGLDRAERQAAIARVTERCWLGDVIDRPIGQLSKGYRQRVGLADSLLHNPKVLILDEPTVGLDPAQIRETRSLIRELAAQHTIILCSHILPEVEATCQRTIIINRGKIVASGSPAELRARIGGDSRLIAEIKGPTDEVVSAIRGLDGVSDLHSEQNNGWTRLTVTTQADLCEEIYQLSASKKWSIRELRREIASLEDYFVKIVAEAQ